MYIINGKYKARPERLQALSGATRSQLFLSATPTYRYMRPHMICFRTEPVIVPNNPIYFGVFNFNNFIGKIVKWGYSLLGLRFLWKISLSLSTLLALLVINKWIKSESVIISVINHHYILIMYKKDFTYYLGINRIHSPIHIGIIDTLIKNSIIWSLLSGPPLIAHSSLSIK